MAKIKDKVGAFGQYLKGSDEHVVSYNVGDTPSGVDPAQWSNNPYAEYDYRHTGLQKILEGLGFRTNYDAFKESMAANAREHASQLLEKAHNEEYDSPEAQNARLRAAGMNPDLAGETSSGSSSPMEPDPNAPIAPSDDFDTFMGFGASVMQAVQMASGIASSGMDMVSMIADLRGKKIANDHAQLSLIADATMALTDPSDRSNFPQQGVTGNANNYILGLTQLFGSRRARRYFRGVNRASEGLAHLSKEADVRNALASDWTELHDKTSGDGWSMFTSTMTAIRKGLSDDLWSNLRKMTKLESRKLENAQQYEDVRADEGIPGAIAHNEGVLSGYDVTEQGADISLKQRNLAMRNTMDSMIKQLNNMADNGNWFAGITAIFLQFMGARYLGM